MPPLFVDGVEIESVFVDGVEQETVFADGVEVFAAHDELFQLTIGNFFNGAFLGYQSGQVGSVEPPTYKGLTIFSMGVNSSNVFFFNFNASAQIPGITTVHFIWPENANLPTTAVWDGSAYTASFSGVLYLYLEANIGNTVPAIFNEL